MRYVLLLLATLVSGCTLETGVVDTPYGYTHHGVLVAPGYSYSPPRHYYRPPSMQYYKPPTHYHRPVQPY